MMWRKYESDSRYHDKPIILYFHLKKVNKQKFKRGINHFGPLYNCLHPVRIPIEE